MFWSLLYVPLLSGAITVSQEREPRSKQQEDNYSPASLAEIKAMPDQAGMEIIRKMLPGVHRHSLGNADTDSFEVNLDAQCFGTDRALVLESGGRKNTIYFSKIQRFVTTRYMPPHTALATNFLLFSYQNSVKEQYQFIVEENQEGDLSLLANIFTEFIQRESKKIPCEGEHEQPELATAPPPESTIPPSKNISPSYSAVSLHQLKDICAGKTTELPSKKIDYLGTINFLECAYQQTEEEISKLYKTIKEKQGAKENFPGGSILAICGNATLPSSQRCDLSVRDFGNEALAYRRAENSALRLEEKLGEEHNLTLVPLGNGTGLDKRNIEVYLIQEEKSVVE